ncbi:competence protein ComK [Peribacillus sp. NPDC097284]|uniref:competence protein ComK n=1 Tax=Peribacillus sp. NPDC097284 TaxID=3364401 RepID=UPI00380C69D7
MVIRKRYLINQKTEAMVGEYHVNGEEMTRVIEGKEMFLVKESPLTILNNTFIYLGYNLEGALKGAKSVLGGKYRLPVCINAELGMVWFSSNSFRKTGGIWFSYIHIRDLIPISKKETMVLTNYGHRISVPMSLNQIDFKKNQSAFLHTTLAARTQRIKTFLFEPESGFTLCKDPGDINYRVREKEEK